MERQTELGRKERRSNSEPSSTRHNTTTDSSSSSNKVHVALCKRGVLTSKCSTEQVEKIGNHTSRVELRMTLEEHHVLLTKASWRIVMYEYDGASMATPVD